MNDNQHCCGRGGARPGCGRKPGTKTRPVRLPEWLLQQLDNEGDIRTLIITACKEMYNLSEPDKKEQELLEDSH